MGSAATAARRRRFRNIENHHDKASMNTPSERAAQAELKRLIEEFFRAVSFTAEEKPTYSKLHELFIEPGLLIKNSGHAPEVASVAEFIQSRQRSVDAGELTHFQEVEMASTTQLFGNVAQRFTAYAKAGMLNGVRFAARGMICTQFILTPAGWRMSSMAWDDERGGLKLPSHLVPNELESTT